VKKIFAENTNSLTNQGFGVINRNKKWHERGVFGVGKSREARDILAKKDDDGVKKCDNRRLGKHERREKIGKCRATPIYKVWIGKCVTEWTKSERLSGKFFRSSAGFVRHEKSGQFA